MYDFTRQENVNTAHRHYAIIIYISSFSTALYHKFDNSNLIYKLNKCNVTKNCYMLIYSFRVNNKNEWILHVLTVKSVKDNKLKKNFCFLFADIY